MCDLHFSSQDQESVAKPVFNKICTRALFGIPQVLDQNIYMTLNPDRLLFNVYCQIKPVKFIQLCFDNIKRANFPLYKHNVYRCFKI